MRYIVFLLVIITLNSNASPPRGIMASGIVQQSGGQTRSACVVGDPRPQCCTASPTQYPCTSRPTTACCSSNSQCYWGKEHGGTGNTQSCFGNDICTSSLTCNQRHTSNCCSSKSECTWDGTNHQCKINCNAETKNNCSLTASNHGQKQTGTCTTDTGTCSRTCNDGQWVRKSDDTHTCRSWRRCESWTPNSLKCPKVQLNHGGQDVRNCIGNYTGTNGCSYRCNDSFPSGRASGCKRKCSGTHNSTKCPSVGLFAHGTTQNRQCNSGYTGSGCSYTCNNGSLGGSVSCTQAVCQLSMLSSYCIPYNGYASWSGNPGYVDISGQSRTFTNNTNVFCVRQKIMHSPPFSHIVKEFRYSFLRCDNGSWRTRNYRNCQAKPNVTTTFNGRTYSQPYLSHNTTITLAAVGISYLLCHCFDGRGRCYIDQSH